MPQPTDLGVLGLNPLRQHLFAVSSLDRLPAGFVMKNDQMLLVRNTGQILVGNGSSPIESATAIGGASPVGNIAAKSYTIPSNLDLTTSMQDVNSANAKISFTPTSTGKVLIRWNYWVLVNYLASGQDNSAAVRLVDTATETPVTGSQRPAFYGVTANAGVGVTNIVSCSTAWLITGLTAGATLEYKLQASKTNNGLTVQMSSYGSTDYTHTVTVDAVA